ncbi:MAG: hypothetical protein JRN57_03840 [Nitrososphaerota archaeon]|nr:hypothetical protein [Nitrososphaerota archaeon]
MGSCRSRSGTRRGNASKEGVVAAALEKVKREGETCRRILTDGESAAIVKATVH